MDRPAEYNDQLYYFEIEYVNYTHGNVHFGYSFESSGEIYKYTICPGGNTDVIWRPNCTGVYTSDDLQNKFSHARKYVDSIKPEDMNYYINLMYGASRGMLSTPVPLIHNAGELTYKCYLYDAENELYKEVLLHQDGEYLIINKSEEALVLTMWLKMNRNKVIVSNDGNGHGHSLHNSFQTYQVSPHIQEN